MGERKGERQKYIAGNSPGCMTVKKRPFVEYTMAHTAPLFTPLHTNGNEEEMIIHREPTRVCEGEVFQSNNYICLHDIILKQPLDQVST